MSQSLASFVGAIFDASSSLREISARETRVNNEFCDPHLASTNFLVFVLAIHKIACYDCPIEANTHEGREMERITEITTKLAIDAKATGFDFGDLYDDDWNLTDDEWDQVCDEAEALMPTVKVPASVYAAWARANADFRAEQRAERMAFNFD